MSSAEAVAHKVAQKAQRLSTFSPYGYTPEKSAGIAYIVVFAILGLIHIGMGIRYKYWLVFATLIPGTFLEVIGWAGRLWSAYNVYDITPFLMQIASLIIGPAFYSAWAYTILGYCITQLGPAYSLLKPNMYLAVFVTADVISLVIQAIGGGKAAVAAQEGTDTHSATKVMLAGILFQLGTMTVFVALASDFILRVIFRKPYNFLKKRHSKSAANAKAKAESKRENENENDSPSTPEEIANTTEIQGEVRTEGGMNRTAEIKKGEKLLAGVAFASAMIFVRGIYRSIELAQGWSGYLITHEVYFIYLDGLPMVLCLAAFAVAHPGWLLPRRKGWIRAK
ncbi:uncharacterized protein I303_102614 [Kwoniella dejecticola CBS 10117]|uniref:RTA1 like protein n=1 Tax=Kwoniella dejecticola CBS 10117 TaxID=1296121 RepID=A0A1A6A987_9TREE|nr:uncharacterized protein I303_02628 [Kwoniella dejecticola CBS 10117]OBR86619.1 hypothetical protein I303_02628 [Kwoniella dejecticola CBS 10117]